MKLKDLIRGLSTTMTSGLDGLAQLLQELELEWERKPVRGQKDVRQRRSKVAVWGPVEVVTVVNGPAVVEQDGVIKVAHELATLLRTPSS